MHFILKLPKSLYPAFKVLRPTRHKICHFGDVLPSQPLGLVPNKTRRVKTRLRRRDRNELVQLSRVDVKAT